MSHRGQGKHPCHLCVDNDPPIEKPVLDHILEAHWKELHLSPGMDFDMLLGMLENAQLEILSKFSVIFNQHW